MECKDWNPEEKLNVKPKVLLIGHDPRLQNSEDKAEYALYSNFYFNKEVLKSRSEKQKYGLAAKSFGQILDITNGRFKAEEIYVTNLCNKFLPSTAKKNQTVYIPETDAKDGYKRIVAILSQYKTIEYVFPMSQQVNYWLQYFGLYHTNSDFLENAKPKQKGIDSEKPYYEAIQQGKHPFLNICGKVYEMITGQKVIPILHTKQYNRLMAYFPCYERIRDTFRKLK